MTTQIDLHGAEVLYLQDQTAPITVGPSSVVGLVGAATDVAAPKAATLAAGAGNAALLFTAATPGSDGNTISVVLVDPGGNNQALAITVNGREITASLATGATGDITTTGQQLVAAWAASAQAAALCTLANATGSSGADTVVALAKMNLSGGLDAGELAARLAAGAGNAALTFTAATPGAAGNTVVVELSRPNAANASLAVTVDGRTIKATLATGADGAVTTTGQQLVTAWAAVAAAVALCTLANATGSSGASVVAPLAPSALAGGRDAPFPLNEPVVVQNPAAAAQLGKNGSLPKALADVWRTAGRGGATVVVVRTADDTAANVIGARAGASGVYALLKAEARTGQKPRLIAAPALETTAAALALEAVADELRAIPVVNLSGAAYADALAARASLAHAYAVWPQFRIFDAASGGLVDRSNAALTIGHMVRVDTEESFAASPSNRRLQDVAGTKVAIDWQIDSRNATANLLSRAFIATAIRRRGGLHLWGNRLADGELITHRRVRHLIGDALLAFIADYIDRNVDVPFVENILDRMNGYLRSQTLAGIVSGGRAWFDAAYNTPDTLAANKVTFSFDLGLHAVAEQLTFRQSVSGIYNEDIINQLTGEEA